MHRSWRALRTDYHIILIHKEYFQDIAPGVWQPGTIFVQNHYREFIEDDPRWKDSRAWHPLQYHQQTVLVPRSVRDKMSGAISFDLVEVGSHVIHCGLFALEVAMWMGFNPIYLLGVDLHHGEGHFYKEEEDYHCPKDPKRDIRVWLWEEAARHIGNKRPKLKIYNANYRSALRAFEFKSPYK